MTSPTPVLNRALPGSFQRWWAASAASNLGDGMRVTALPLLATQLTPDPRLVAGVAIAEQLPWLLFTLPGGALADRFDRRVLRVRLDLLRALTVLALAVLVATGHASIIVVFAVAAILGSAESIVDTSSMALVPSLLDDDQLERAAGLLSSTELIANALLGPPIGGLLFALAVWIPFGFDAASFVVAAAIAASIPGHFRPDPAPADRSAAPSLRVEIAEGFRALWQRSLLRNLALVSAVLGFANLMSIAVFVLFARETLGLGPTAIGVLMVAPAIGGVLGSLVAHRLTSYPLGRVLTACVALSGAALLSVGLTSNPWVVAVATAVEAIGIVVWNVLTVALRQRLVPDHLLGRVGASYRFIVFIATPLGALVGGLIATATTLATTFVVAGSIVLATSLLVPLATRRGTAVSQHVGPEAADATDVTAGAATVGAVAALA